MKDSVKNEILSNKDDLVEGTFCYSLFEDACFSPPLLDALIAKSGSYMERYGHDAEVSEVL